jgi:hypothetical protein
MALHDQEDKRPPKRSRGSVNNGQRLAGLTGKAGNKGAADWGGCDPRWLAAVIAATCRLGGACLFSYSRDGGAYGLLLLLDGERAQMWFNGDADLDVELEQVFAYLETLQ